MLLLHLLLAALIAEDYELSAKQFEALRAALKASPQELVTCFKCALLPAAPQVPAMVCQLPAGHAAA